MYSITYRDFVDKVHGCWYGKCLGGAAGAPVEGVKKFIDVNDFSEIMNPDLPNDDLDLQLLWLYVLEKKGTLINSCDLADAWVERCWYPFSEYGYFLKNYMRGVKPPYSGVINNSFFMEGMGCPIRSEIWGIISAGNPELASQYAYMDATLDHGENSVYAEQFLAAIESMAFFESDMEKLVETGMKYVPRTSKLHKCFKKILFMYTQDDSDWMAARKMVLNEYSHPDFTNVVQNLGFVLIALLYGKGDMRDTINIALKCGYDTDCTCASAGAVIGIIKGYSGLDDNVKSLVNDYFICGVDAPRPNNSIKDLAASTAKIALKTPNYELEVKECPFPLPERPKKFTGFELEKVTKKGIEEAKKNITPIKWDIYGPFFDQLDQPINPDYPSPHSEGCVLPDIVCMVNSEVFIDKDYITDFEGLSPACTIDAYEDFIDVDSHLTLEGQMCCYAKTKVNSPADQKVWIVVGNNDGFSIKVNGEKVLEKDEIRMWTPYNNFTLVDMKEGENEIEVKLLRRTENLKFGMGFRIYDGENHWHKTKWHTDIY